MQKMKEINAYNFKTGKVSKYISFEEASNDLKLSAISIERIANKRLILGDYSFTVNDLKEEDKMGYGQSPNINMVIKKLKNQKQQTEVIVLEQLNMVNTGKEGLTELYKKYEELIQKTKNKIISAGQLSGTPPTDIMIYDAELRIYKQIIRDLQALNQDI